MDQAKQQVAKQNNPVVSPDAKPLFFQPKLSINQPNDAYEQEADHMADQVMRMADPLAKPASFFQPAGKIIQRKCAHCEQEEKMLHRKESSTGEVESSSQLAGYVSSLGTAGQTLSTSSRQFFEPRFGHDFSNVRIHADSGAAQSAQSINALAYTTGNNIVFNSGQYSPETPTGQRLMAHELTHVVQQGATKPSVQRAENDPLDGGLPPGGAPQPTPSVDPNAAPENVPPPEPVPDQSNKVCGPKIDDPLIKVLGDVTKEFSGWSAAQQKENCDDLTSLWHVANEWDIENLFYEYLKPSAQGCGIPEAGENSNACSQTVEVDGKCNLAGTVNYVLWGHICKLCMDKLGSPSHATMIALLYAYNLVGIDNPGPPGAWAEAGWNGFTGTAPNNPNRDTCKTTCPTKSRGPFTWRWLPNHKGI